MDQTKAVIFDFDGVILDSATIKTEAFLELFDEYPEHQKAIKGYHIEHQGITRYKKFEWIYSELLKKPYTEEVKEKLGEGFSALVFGKIMQAKTIPGALDFLTTLRQNNIPGYIASGTPDAELEKILENRELSKYFKAAYGSDISKEQAIDRIANDENLDYSELLFVGDAITDFRAAMSRNVPFVAVYSEEMEGYWQEKNIKPVKNLMQISDEIDQLTLGMSSKAIDNKS